MAKKLAKTLNYLGLLFCLIAFWGGLIYRFYALNKTGAWAAVILALISLGLLQYFYLISGKKTSRPALNAAPEQAVNTPLSLKIFLGFIYLGLALACFFLLYKHGTTAALISPWQAMPKYFFVLYGLASLILGGLALINKKYVMPFLALHYFLSFSVALIIYRLGYGYDPFIHQATENLIARVGAVEPKTFYYLGQYGLTVVLHQLTSLPIVWLDRLLVPLTAALSLPLVLKRALDRWFDSPRLNLMLIWLLPALTFPFFIVTTPQNLAYLLLLLTIILGLVCRDLYDFLVILLLALTALITQPVAGLPALIFAGFLAVYHSDRLRFKNYFYAGLAVLTVFLLPALFYWLNKSRLDGDAAGGLFSWLNISSAGQSNFLLNLVYFYGYNFYWLIGLAALSGIFLAWRHRRHCRLLIIYLIMSAALFLSAYLTASLPFAFLIDYERGAYGLRILTVAVFFLLPFFLLALYSLWQAWFKQKLFLKLSFFLFFAALLTAGFYLSYPRYDDYFNSRGYSVSAADFKAVAWINENAGADYLVLANQQVSAAALSRFGFKKYYATAAGQLFYYPIPTASPLYDFYLDMAYNKKPDQSVMRSAMDLAGVNQAYFVLNKYWFDFNKTLAEAKLSAVSWQDFDGQVYVFKYTK